ncbi:MAG TPA: response regulator transcription factor [Urbifossiella sp.]|nr:response regulator transcription factor [Urbifossiella sp.]
MIRVVLADDHAVVREGLKALIHSQEGMSVVGEAATSAEALALVAAHNPDVAVLDVSMPELSGIELAAKLRALHPSLKILALTVHENPAYVRKMLEAGASGYVLKRAATSELVQAIRTVAGGGTYLDSSVAGSLVNGLSHPNDDGHVQHPELSDREAEVMMCIARGYSNKQIAARLQLSVKTVETYKARSMEKLGIRSRIDIVKFAVKQGWLADDAVIV